MTLTLKKLLLTCIIIVFSIGLLYRFYTKMSGTLEYLSSYIAYPVLTAQHAITAPITAWFVEHKYSSELKQQLILYKEKIENLESHIIALQDQQAYSKDIQDLVSHNYINRYSSPVQTLAQILVKNFDEKRHFMLIDAGLRKGIAKDNVVIYKNYLLGRITEVYPYYSKVTLITDSSCKVAAYCAATGVKGIYQGTNSVTKAALNYVNHLDKLEHNDLILSSGEGLLFPRGFGLGHIRGWEVTDFSYSVDVEPLLDFTQLQYCYVIQKGNEWHKSQEMVNREISSNTLQKKEQESREP